ncbi:tyrosine-type recombinase/integrase [Paraburkholderia sp. CNPSo 3272]|uniref:tyrosine-type recombinase/integrase n=1 Tax=Paraburkholderia sp. CNPSo 3272 TaxID=2940931 RepID=UPI0020B8BDC6|nr:tyrosine-type recombinase/integrase [Paraburkholderia sp. CNPSo 3272]MCP3728374.1 tyrosine-type recombinase/integrase [Paraburkholderia sp. CNPSo 3272]
MNVGGEVIEYLAADSLQNYITSLYRAAGLAEGYSSHSGRRTFASRLVAQGHSLETVQILLGHSHLYVSEGNIIFVACGHEFSAESSFFHSKIPTLC